MGHQRRLRRSLLRPGQPLLVGPLFVHKCLHRLSDQRRHARIRFLGHLLEPLNLRRIEADRDHRSSASHKITSAYYDSIVTFTCQGGYCDPPSKPPFRARLPPGASNSQKKGLLRIDAPGPGAALARAPSAPLHLPLRFRKSRSFANTCAPLRQARRCVFAPALLPGVPCRALGIAGRMRRSCWARAASALRFAPRAACFSVRGRASVRFAALRAGSLRSELVGFRRTRGLRPLRAQPPFAILRLPACQGWPLRGHP